MSWRDELLAPVEILDSRLMSRVMCALVDARREKRIGRQELAAMSGVNRSTISKIAMGAANPSVWTLIRMLTSAVKPASLPACAVGLQGQTLDVVPIPDSELRA